MPNKKKRPPRKKERPPPARRPARANKRPGAGRVSVPASAPRPPGPLQYKVVELSTVDEATLERTLNEWVGKGWTFDGVQFAMRESSKRPAMAFAFFTREGAPAVEDPEAARSRLQQLADTGSPTVALLSSPDYTGNAAVPRRPGFVSAYERLAQLAGEDEPERPEHGVDLEPEE
jgi:hypothetical protein